MGLFSNRYKTYVGTTVSRVVEDNAMPNSVTSGVLKAITNNGSVPEYVMEDLVASVGVRAEKMFRYAKDHYTHGLPGGTVLSSQVGVAEAEAILSSLSGGPALIDYVHLGPPNSLHYGWIKAIELYGYNTTTNTLSGVGGTSTSPAYMEDMVVVVPEGSLNTFELGVLDQWGTSPRSGQTPDRTWSGAASSGFYGFTPVVVDSVSEDYIRIYHVRKIPVDEQTVIDWENDPYRRGMVSIPISGPLADPLADYFHVKYSVNGVTKYWMYRAGSGTYPTLDRLVNKSVEVGGEFFPFAYFRFNKTSEAADTGSESYRTTKKMVKHLGMDFDAVATAIDENPDIADVEQAMLVMAVPANTEDPLELRYLYTFFDKLFYTRGRTYQSPIAGYTQHLLTGELNLPRTSILIEDNRFKMVLSDAGLYKKRVVGILGPIGTHTMAMSNEVVRLPYVDENYGGVTYVNYTLKYRYYRKQTSRFLYDEILVVDLQMMYHVLEGYATTADDVDSILLVPLDHSITEGYTISEREALYSRSLHFVFNSVQVVKIKWYQTAWFQLVLIVVAIVIIIFTYGEGFELLAAAIATGSAVVIWAAVLPILMNLFIGLIVSYVVKLFVKEVGMEAAMVIAVLAALAGYGQALQAGSMSLAPWASQLLQISLSLAKGVSAVLKDSMDTLRSEYESFSLFQDEAAKELEAANKLLEEKNHVNPFVIFGESPNDFYNRTVHSGNVGVISLSAISSFVDNALALPKLSATIGE
jgi:hypothetical protein